MKIKLKQAKRSKPERADDIDVIEDSLADLTTAVCDELGKVVVERDCVITALMLAAFSGSHLLIEGPPGTAKSYVVARFMEHLDPKLSQFKILLTKDTVSDAITGPVNLPELRKSGRFKYNTEGMLPRADFAMLEEVYRARGTVLDTMLTILNERVFMNAGKTEECPLRSAFGTTNFVDTTNHLEAFQDRWTIHCKVYPLSSESRKFLFSLPRRDINTITKLELRHFKANDPANVKIPKRVLAAYLELIDLLNPKMLSRPITDRRIVQTMRLIQTGAMMDGKTELELSDLYYGRYGLTVIGDPAELAEFDKVYESVLDRYENAVKEAADIEDLRLNTEKLVSFSTRLLSVPDISTNSSLLDKLRRAATTAEDLFSVLCAQPEFNFTPSASYMEKRKALVEEVDMLRTKLNEAVTQSLSKNNTNHAPVSR